MGFPQIPPTLRRPLRAAGLEDLFRYLGQDVYSWINNNFDTLGDVRMLGPGKGVILVSPDGNIRKRLRLSNAGTLELVDV